MLSFITQLYCIGMSLSYSMVCIVIVNWNGKKHLEDCLTSLQYQSYADFKVAVVDNGSTDGSVHYIQQNYPSIKLVQLKRNMGYSFGMNVGYRTLTK